MRLTFLSAAMPLSKALSYSSADDEYSTSSYPMARRMTSRTVDVSDMFAFGEAIDHAGELGEALLFGSLTRPIVDESRAGLTDNSLSHEWICFDFDKVEQAPTVDGAEAAIREYLPPCCHGVEHVVQLSASCMLPRASHLSAHVFMRLSAPQTTAQLKAFLTWCNFRSPQLMEQISLSESGMALKFKLDRSVVDASRLLYVSPPRCVGFKAPNKEVLVHFPGTEAITIPTFESIDSSALKSLTNSLREQAGFDPRDFKTIKFQGHDVIKGADEGVIADIKSSGGNYLRFNLNGGDSYGYWIDLRHPDVIGNFKGEPFLLTKEVDKKFYESLIKATKSMPVTPRGTEAQEVLAFYATNRGSALYIGTYERNSDVLRVDKSTETAASAWLRQFGMPFRPALPHYDLTYDIGSDIRYEEGYPVINLYERTNLMKQFGALERTLSMPRMMEQLDESCPVTMMFVRSITGDPRSCEGFLNWLAYIFQNRIKTGTAWLLWGTEGSGKGKFLEHVAKPLFGQSSVGNIMISNVDKQFNSLLEGKLLVNIDEAAMSRSRDKVEAMSKLRNWITEPTMVINEKGISEREVPSFVNFIVSSNDFRPLVINSGDRRFHVGTRQEKRLLPTANEFATLVQGEELPHFARLIGSLMVDEHWVRNPEMNEQKARLFESTHSLIDTVALAIADGDAGFFFEARPSNVLLGASNNSGLLPIKQYDDLLRGMHNGTLTVLKHEDLYVLFHVIVNDTKTFPENQTAQKQIFARYGVAAGEKSIHLDNRTGKKEHGVKAPRWKPVPEHLRERIDLGAAPQSTVTPIRGRAK